MTFCLGISTNDGLVGIADTRLLSGNECLVARKIASYSGPGFSFFIMTSGLRSLRDKVLLHFDENFARETAVRDRLYKTVKLYAAGVRRAAEEDGEALSRSELRFNIHSLIGGQMAGDSAHRLYMVYPEGNWVEVGPDTPYQIIGASGYGKPILERSVEFADSMLYAFKVGILAFDSTRRCAADVNFPIDVVLYKKSSFELVEHRFQERDLHEISDWWQDRMRKSVSDLPSEWIERAFSQLMRDAAGPIDWPG
jgi:putative proteasome-type protease